MKIKTMNTVVIPNGLGGVGFEMFGLGEDNKVYSWSYAKSKWMPQWDQKKAGSKK